MNFWLKIGLAVAGIWLLAMTAIYFVQRSKPTAEKVAVYLAQHDLAAETGAPRARSIAHVEAMLNRISYEERQQLQRKGVTRDFFRKLTPEEQLAFLDATLPAGFRQMMESFNKMEPERRKKIVDRALTSMKEREGDAPPPNVDEQVTSRIVDQGLRSFYRDSSADVKLDLAPLIEQMQKNMQSGRR